MGTLELPEGTADPSEAGFAELALAKAPVVVIWGERRKKAAGVRAQLREELRGQPAAGPGLWRELWGSQACACPGARGRAPSTPLSSSKGWNPRSRHNTRGEQTYGIKVKQHYISSVKGFYEKSQLRYKLVKGHFTI